MTPFYSAKSETDSRIVVLSRENLGSDTVLEVKYFLMQN